MAPEIPREGDLIGLPEATKEALRTLRTDVNAVTAPETESHRKFLDSAISSGNRADVVRALQHLQTRSEFSGLRDRIEKMRLDVSSGTLIGIPDQALAHGEWAARSTYQRLFPDWLKLGTLAGGAAWVASWPLQGIAGLFGKGESIAKWRKSLVGGAFVVGALAKGTSDVLNSNMPLGNRLLRQVPIVPAFVDPAPATVNLDERVKRVRDHLNNIDFQRPLTNNAIFIPAINTTEIPVTEIIIRQFAANQTTALQIDAVTLPVATGGRTINASPTAARLEVEYKVEGVTTQISPIVKEKPTNP